MAADSPKCSGDARRLRHVPCGLALGVAVTQFCCSTLVPLATAQVSTPDQRISDAQPLYSQGMPALSGNGPCIMATWLGPGFTGDVITAGIGYAYSLDQGTTWIHESTLPNAPPFFGASGPASSCMSGSGTTHLLTNHDCLQYFRGVGSQPIDWGAPLVALCDPLFPGNFNGDDISAVACDPAGNYVYLTSTEGTEPTATTPGSPSWIRFARSEDDGLSWQPPQQLGGPNAMGSSIAVGADGTVYLSWVDYVLGQVMFTRSTDHGASFALPVSVAGILDNLAARPVGWEHNGFPERIYPYYLFPSLHFAANFPSLAVDRSTGPTRGNLYLTWADHAEGTLPEQLTPITDTGFNDTFEAAQPVPMDCSIGGSLDHFSGTDFVDYYVFDGVAGQTVEVGGDPFCILNTYMELANGQRVKIHDQVLVPPELGVIKPAIVTLRRTGRYFFHVFGHEFGSVYAIRLRRFTPTPGSLARDMRDIVLVRSTDGGATWSGKLRVNRDPAGADQHQPNVAVDGRGRVYVAWYDRRDDPDGLAVAAYAARSDDGGVTFHPDLRLSSRLSPWLGPNGTVPGSYARDRIAIAAGDDFGIVAWTDLYDWPNRSSEIWAARIVDIPTAVEAVSDLSAEPVAGGVRLRWLVNDARGVSALRVYRSGEDGAEAPLGDADIVPTRDGSFEYLDATAEAGQGYSYRLQVRGAAGTQWLGPVTVHVHARVSTLAWRAAGPNPFARGTSLTLAVPRAAEGAVQIYDVQGKAVRTLAEGRFEPGERMIDWDGRDSAGNSAVPGIYFVSAQVGGESVRMRVARVP